MLGLLKRSTGCLIRVYTGKRSSKLYVKETKGHCIARVVMGARCGRLQDITAQWHAHGYGEQLMHSCSECNARPCAAVAAFTHSMLKCTTPHVQSSACEQLVETAAECGVAVEAWAAQGLSRLRRAKKRCAYMLKILVPEGLQRGRAAQYWTALAESLKNRFVEGDDEDLDLIAAELQSEPDYI